MTEYADGKKSVVQKLSELVAWYLTDREIELKFIPNARRTGRLAPEFDFQYIVDGRRCSERALAMMIMIEMQRMNYNFNLAKIISALTEAAWRHYVASEPYPDWLKGELPPLVRRPVGRPRKHPHPIDVEDVI